MIDATEDDGVRQVQLPWFARMLMTFSGIYVVVAMATMRGGFDRIVVPEIIVTVSVGALWLALRKHPRPPRVVKAIEVVTLGVGMTGFCSLALIVPVVHRPDGVVRGALTIVLLSYAAWVPSSAKWTSLIATLMTVPLLTCVYLGYARAGGSVGESALDATLSCATWWIVAVAIAVLFSRTIYGLRKEVRDLYEIPGRDVDPN